MFVGYVNNNGNQSAYEEQYAQLTAFAREKGIKFEVVYADKNFANLQVAVLKENNTLIIHNISVLGSSLAQIVERLKICVREKVAVWTVAENYRLEAAEISPDFMKGLEFAVDLRKQMLSQVTKEKLKQAKEAGKVLGRRWTDAAKNKRKLDGKEAEIKALLEQGYKQQQVAAMFGVTYQTLWRFMKENNLSVQNIEPEDVYA